MASIRYKDEAKLLKSGEDTDQVYVETILPEKMKYNLEALKKFSLSEDLKIMIRTFFAVVKNRNTKAL